ncbi:hypothetical protein HZH66_001061 [Vespula vulgaris]|uniref:Uncharacterized protein n=1 Tax=Vespula vulgaris TaxID=7454 RepID=A0A834KTN8_VESVU|nr:hypothetical protein HZH66_001061 [Vespula vulgaris]
MEMVELRILPENIARCIIETTVSMEKAGRGDGSWSNFNCAHFDASVSINLLLVCGCIPIGDGASYCIALHSGACINHRYRFISEEEKRASRIVNGLPSREENYEIQKAQTQDRSGLSARLDDVRSVSPESDGSLRDWIRNP